jgi:hypothetical protein
MFGLIRLEGKRGAFVQRDASISTKGDCKKKPAGSFENLRAQ